MSSLQDLEQDVFQFLNTLANVRKVDVSSTAIRGQKSLKVVTYISKGTHENFRRVHATEDLLKERHQNVTFDFRCSTLKDSHE